VNANAGQTTNTNANANTGESSSGTSAEAPEFPWPPEASASTRVQSRLLVKDGQPALLSDVAERLAGAMNSAGYSQLGYYHVPGGFALASQLEQFRPDGTALDGPERWSTQAAPPKLFSHGYFSTLLKGKTGRFRVIVFTVTNQPFTQTGKEVSSEQAADLAAKGSNVLPASIGQAQYSNDYTCTALIYEFVQAGSDKPAEFAKRSSLPAQTHLQKSKILSFLEG
jgi:hypothetical protein